MSFAITMKVVSSLIGATLLLLLICALSIRIATAEDEGEDSDQLPVKTKQTIKQNEECEDKSVCKQAAENNLILCPIGSTCVFMTNDFVPYNLATPR
ncbi:MAG TPA: hypothetical protein VKA09_10260 [Nitrososphaeraceae archaeon]|nr:hypothetical protein [Nitrososphaeraceae archaeon]